MSNTPPQPMESPQRNQLTQLFPHIEEALQSLAAPKSKFTEKLPTLTKTNFDAWDCALRYVLLGHNRSCLLEPTFDLNTYTGSNYSMMEKACANNTRMITASLDPKLFELLPGSVIREPPFKVHAALQSLIKKDSALTHSILKAEALALKMSDETTIEQYVEKHLFLRARMVTSNYPEITDEKTTVTFMVDGLAHHPLFRIYVGGWHCYGLPTTVDELHQRLHACNEHHKKADSTKSLPPAGRFTHTATTGETIDTKMDASNEIAATVFRMYGQSSFSRDMNKIVQFISNLQEAQAQP